MNHTRTTSRRGTVYVVVLAVLSIVITVSLSSLSNARSELASASRTSDEAMARSIARSGLEAAIQMIQSDPAWRESASGTKLLPRIRLGDGSFRVAVVDPEDGDLLDDYAEPFEITAIAEFGHARQMYRARFEYAAEHDMPAERVLKHHPLMYWPLRALDDDKSEDFREVKEAQLKGKIDYDQQDPTGVYDMPVLHSTLQTYYEISHDDSMEVDFGSMSIWFQPSSLHVSSGTIQVVCSKHKYDEEEALQFSIACNNGRVWLLLDHDERYRTHNIGDISGDTWHHVVVTWGSSGWSTYLDGKPTGGLDIPLGFGTAWTPKANKEAIRIGAAKGLLGRHGDKDMGHYFHGKICDAAFFAYELTPAQVEELAASPPTPRPLKVIHDSIERVVD